jgi:hypothetical protein
MKPLTFTARTVLSVAGCAALLSCAPKPKAPLSAPQGAWISLFDGHDLNGWTAKIAGEDPGNNYRNTFRVENGMLRVSYQQYDRFGDRFGSLFYNRRFSHYWLRAQYRFVGELAPGAPRWAFKNSGIQLHSQDPASMSKAQQFPVSVEFDLVGGRFFGANPTGDVCHYGTLVSVSGVRVKELCSKLSDLTIRDDQWVTVLAQVDGAKLVRQAVNGGQIVEYTDLALDGANPDTQRLLAAGAPRPLSSGFISIQSNGFPIEFKSIEVLPVP